MIKAEWTNKDTLDLQPTCNQLATDCISRQAAIAEFSCCELTPDGGIDANYAIDFLEQMPSAPQWIPCSERLPEPRMAVLGYAPKYQNIYALYYDTVLGWMIWSPIRNDCFPNSQGEITAWMPLPEPYKGVTE